jgi:hypothetical protein
VRSSSPRLEAPADIAVKPRASTPANDPHRVISTPPPAPRRASMIEAPQIDDAATQPAIEPVSHESGELLTEPDQPVNTILGIGMSSIGHTPPRSAVSGEIPMKIAPGARVLVPGPDGLMQSATVRQLLQGYYELEVGGSGDTIWVPVNGVVPE